LGIIYHYVFLQRFGSALVSTGQLSLKSKIFAKDFRPIDDQCPCSTCKNHTRAYLHTIVQNETVSCHLLTIHNVAYQVILCKSSAYSISGENAMSPKEFDSGASCFVSQHYLSEQCNVCHGIQSLYLLHYKPTCYQLSLRRSPLM
jgi:queuine/archaeosine tRNA-ribosyltransferase